MLSIAVSIHCVVKVCTSTPNRSDQQNPSDSFDESDIHVTRDDMSNQVKYLVWVLVEKAQRFLDPLGALLIHIVRDAIQQTDSSSWRQMYVIGLTSYMDTNKERGPSSILDVQAIFLRNNLFANPIITRGLRGKLKREDLKA